MKKAGLARKVARSVSQGLKPALIMHTYAGTKVPAYLRNDFFSTLESPNACCCAAVK
jgi:hypothetical protein